MRRKDREQDADFALNVFDKAPYITVSFITPSGEPYGVPLSLVRSGDNLFYFHCALQGKKLDCIRNNNIVTLSAVNRCSPTFDSQKGEFTLQYNSAMARGVAEIVENRSEKIEALSAICSRFLPNYMEHFSQAIERSLDRTAIVKITLTEPPVGKSKQL